MSNPVEEMDGARVTVYRAPRVITMNGPDAGALAVGCGRVLAVGTAEALWSQFPRARRADLDGTVLPGFHDAHMHMSLLTEAELQVDVSPEVVGDRTELLDRLRAAAASRRPGEWVRATGYHDANTTPEGRITRDDLDAVTREHPVLVKHVAGHWGVVNTVALALAGINDATEPPPGGAFGRTDDGRVDGILYEQSYYDFAFPTMARGETVVPHFSLQDRLAGISRVARRLLAAGITSIGEAHVGFDELELLQAWHAQEVLGPRVDMLVTDETLRYLVEAGLRLPFGDDRLRLIGVKAYVDGAVGGRTCLLEEPFTGTTDDHGVQMTSTEDLADLIRRARTHRCRVAVHANGDRAISLLLDIFEQVEARDPWPGARPRIEHCTVVTDEILRRMRPLGAVAVPFVSYVGSHGENLIDWYGADRVERMFAHRSFLDAGIPVAASSDSPCAPFDPLLGLRSAVTRRGSDGVLVGPSQRISIEEALRLYTTGAAYAAGSEDRKGRIAPGYLADFVVLSDDPRSVDPERLVDDVEVRQTYVGGTCAWDRDTDPSTEEAAQCPV